MNNITIIGAGHVGLLTGVSLADVGHQVICYDIDKEKISQLAKGISPFYEPGLDELLNKNIANGRLLFTSKAQTAFSHANIIYIAVGTPKNKTGDTDLSFVEQAAVLIGQHAAQTQVIVVTKSTVPVGTNEKLKKLIEKNTENFSDIRMVSNPEFLREGNALQDIYFADRIVIGSDCSFAASIIEEINQPFHVPIFKTDLHSAEMIKYSSNAFLAMKISFINEIADFCEKAGADIEEVAAGIGLDSRIGSDFLHAGIGYGGSCFPKDMQAMISMMEEAGEKPDILKAVVKANGQRPFLLLKKAIDYFGVLKGKKAAVLGLSFKPNTDDIREAPSIMVVNELLKKGVSVVAYDPKAIENTKKILGSSIQYAASIEEAITMADMVFIHTDWEEIKTFPLSIYEKNMKNPVLFDGRNCYSMDQIKKHKIDYFSIGRQPYFHAFNKQVKQTSSSLK